jgi:hypothetical protein
MRAAPKPPRDLSRRGFWLWFVNQLGTVGYQYFGASKYSAIRLVQAEIFVFLLYNFLGASMHLVIGQKNMNKQSVGRSYKLGLVVVV